MTIPYLSILLPAYNEAVELPGTLARIRETGEALGLKDWELIVCDNNSTDETAAIARAAGAQVVFEPHNQIARARNRAASAARGEWLLFLDADTRLEPALLAAAMGEMARPDVVGGGALVAFPESLPYAVRSLTGFWNWISVQMGWAAGCFIFCRRQAWENVRGFDERYYASEEVWFSRRLQKWGKKKGQQFVILKKLRVMTSGRKFLWHTPIQLLGQLALLAIPGALRNRAFCRLWYNRPSDSRGSKNSRLLPPVR